MAEPMSAGEIEDVLASIRRLVSQDVRGRSAAASPAAAATTADAPSAAGSKLILTPALRVIEPAPPRPPEGDGDDTWADEVGATPQASKAAAVAATIARLVPDWDETDDRAAAGKADPAPARLSWIDVADSFEYEPADPPRFVHRGGGGHGGAAARAAEPAEQPALIATTEDVLDEAVLREIVRAVLREELQGQLGERITRNIRKLVRAEVYRSLTLRDFD
ncbi:MAG TPA: hypothetical protein PKD10_06350 [Paracoccaceae bacterium]|nr:hypothetical protein [Paracoccaceae bacterium]HMO72466.1 hypothetical protein [Paracoccaceae bacterium]